MLDPKSPGLNVCLEAFGCAVNGHRDCTVYDREPRFWEKRPLTPMMINWAAADIRRLFELREKQIEYSKKIPYDVANRCLKDTTKRLKSLREKRFSAAISVEKKGRLIGKGGCTIRAIEAKCDSILRNMRTMQIGDKENNEIEDAFVVFSKSDKDLKQCLQMIGRYTEFELLRST